MKHKIFIFLLPILAAALFSLLPACRKHSDPPDPLPPATQVGANTFGCYIDGKPWVAWIDPEIFDPSLRKIEASYDEPGIGMYDEYGLSINAQKVTVKDTIYEFIIFGLKPIFEEGVVDIFSLEHIGSSIHFDNPVRAYEIDVSLPQMFEITNLDTEQNIFSGLFELTIVSKDKSDTLRITDGRFDIKYQVW
ncbi:MAG: hypothetical protein Q7T20_01730 [Saprospiraceae bacterium]|nr:hypothetical protein [Saprospiraceae bacterium]